MDRAVVVTTINPPNAVMRSIAAGCRDTNAAFYVIGDAKGPKDFAVDGARFLSLEAQRASGFRLGLEAPTGHYARKNIGYLEAIRDGAATIQETDDDNAPLPDFFQHAPAEPSVPVVRNGGWVNVYAYFSDARIWPRGLPLDAVQSPPPPLGSAQSETCFCPIQQGLADDNPDVDAIYRLVLPLPQRFRPGIQVALGQGSWCPFNSQNTVWHRPAFPLLYLPATCSFRMTDIWRSFVAQRVAWTNGWSVLFHSPTVRQDRNEHDLMRDFEDEISGYRMNARIAAILDALPLRPGPESIPDNLLQCYAALTEAGCFAPEERSLLEAWLADLARIGCI